MAKETPSLAKFFDEKIFQRSWDLPRWYNIRESRNWFVLGYYTERRQWWKFWRDNDLLNTPRRARDHYDWVGWYIAMDKSRFFIYIISIQTFIPNNTALPFCSVATIPPSFHSNPWLTISLSFSCHGLTNRCIIRMGVYHFIDDVSQRHSERHDPPPQWFFHKRAYHHRLGINPWASIEPW